MSDSDHELRVIAFEARTRTMVEYAKFLASIGREDKTCMLQTRIERRLELNNQARKEENDE